MTLSRAIAIIVGFAAFGAAVGLGVGYFLAINFPNYYQHMFSRNGEDVDAVSLGVGLGLTQGLALGTITGVVTMCLLGWYDLKSGITETAGYESTRSTD